MRIFNLLTAAGMLIAAMALTAQAGSMRCGNDIVSINDSAFIVLQRCGEPISRVHVGYTINEEKKRELLIEDWVYGPKNNYYYFLTMIGGRVSEIRSERE